MEILEIKTVRSISTKMYYVLFTKILQRADAASGTVLQKKGVREFVVKSLDRYIYKEFLKISF